MLGGGEWGKLWRGEAVSAGPGPRDPVKIGEIFIEMLNVNL